MSFLDIIKKSVISEFTGTITVDKIIISLLVAFIIGVFIVYVYRKTYSGYKLQSEWTSSETVQYKNGLTLEESEVYLTQAQYDAMSSHAASTIYFIVED